eukprot:4942671-Ditylum_brightwellii.AAC.1
MQHFNGNIQMLELVGGTHIMHSLELMEIAGSDPTYDEKKNEEEKFKAMLLLKRLDPVRYNDLVEELHRSVTVVEAEETGLTEVVKVAAEADLAKEDMVETILEYHLHRDSNSRQYCWLSAPPICPHKQY